MTEIIKGIVLSGIGAYIALFLSEHFKKRSRWETFAGQLWNEQLKAFSEIASEMFATMGNVELVRHSKLDESDLDKPREIFRQSVARLRTAIIRATLVMDIDLVRKCLDLIDTLKELVGEAYEMRPLTEQTIDIYIERHNIVMNYMRVVIHLEGIPPKERKALREEVAEIISAIDTGPRLRASKDKQI
jgi:hypothetical protein